MNQAGQAPLRAEDLECRLAWAITVHRSCFLLVQGG